MWGCFLRLRVFEKNKKEDVSKAKTMLDKIDIEIKSQTEGLYVESIVTTNNGIGRTIIRYKHDNIVLVEKIIKYYTKRKTL